MSDRNEIAPKLDLNLNHSPPRVVDNILESSTQSTMASPTSPPSSCASTEFNQEDNNNNIDNLENSNNPEAISMLLVGCPHCLMYVMIAKDNLKCPKCKSTTLFHFLNDNNNNLTKKKE